MINVAMVALAVVIAIKEVPLRGAGKPPQQHAPPKRQPAAGPHELPRPDSQLERTPAIPVIKASTLKNGNLKGADHGATISVILDHSGPGQGPRLHRHPYDETWVVEEGNLTFQVGDTRHRAGPGDIVIAPPGAPHKFTNDGPGPSKLICIHASPTFETEWLE